jgi:hypothetical protein
MLTKNTKIIYKILLAVGLVGVAVGWRLVNHANSIAPNLEIVTTASVLGALVLGWRGAIFVPLATMIISDMFIGNSSIFVYTWGSFVAIGLMGLVLTKLNTKPLAQIGASAGFAIVSSFLFFVVTNFGVWAHGWYGYTFEGLVACYTMAIPFYRTMIIGNLIILPSVIAVWQLIRTTETYRNLVVDSLVRK